MKYLTQITTVFSAWHVFETMNTSEVQVVPENSSNRNPEVEVSESESEFDLNDPYHAIKQIFNCFDTDGDGFIDR